MNRADVAVPEPQSPHGTTTEAILGICRHMASERDLDALLGLIATEATRLLASDRASIFLHDADRNELVSRVALGMPETVRFDARLGIAGACFTTARTVLVPDVKKDPRFYGALDKKLGYRTRSILAVPLRLRDGRVIGVFELLNKSVGTFETEDAEILEALAAHAAVAIETAQLVEALRRERADLHAQNEALREIVARTLGTQAILGTSEPVVRVVHTIEQLRDSAVSVLLTGESGTGKERAARAIHETSRRSDAPFVAVNCAALPDALVESELFGIEKGVATGVDARPGRFEQAHGGTLFLDEVGDLSLGAQAKILRVLQEGVVERVGGRRQIPVDVRVIAATNRDLAAAIRGKTFREDLFYRLNVVHLRMPALREIPGDIPILAGHFLKQFCAAESRAPLELPAEALARLTSYAWPGNVRELRNEMQRVTALCRGPLVRESDLSDAVRQAKPQEHVAKPDHHARLRPAVRALETRRIREALAANGWNVLKASKELGLVKRALEAKMKRYGIT